MNTNDNGLRRFPRTPYKGDVYVLDDEGFGFVLEGTNLSRGGVFLKTPLLLAAGEPCFVKLELGGGKTINARGHVCRAEASPKKRSEPGIAIAFDYVDSTSTRVLESVTPKKRPYGSS